MDLSFIFICQQHQYMELTATSGKAFYTDVKKYFDFFIIDQGWTLAYDVDMELIAPSGKVLYKDVKISYNLSLQRHLYLSVTF